MASSNDRSGKRSRLGNRQQRGIWKSAHAWKHPWYDALCRKVTALNAGIAGTRVERSLDRTEQALIFASHAVAQRNALKAWGV